MNMCFGVKNLDKSRQEKNKCFVNETSSNETSVDREAKFLHAKCPDKVLRENKNVDEALNSETVVDRRPKSVGAKKSNKPPRSEDKKLRIFDHEKFIDEPPRSETNIIRTVIRCTGERKIDKHRRSEEKKRFEPEGSVDESSVGELSFDRKTKDFSEKSSNKVVEEEKKKRTETERFVGDGLSLRMDTNERDIEVTGDGCRLTMATNRGRIRMVGDGCRLQIGRNSGDIEYTGDGGRVSLGPDSTGTKVHYVGDGGRVDIADGTVRRNVRCSRTSVSGASAARVSSDPRNVDRGGQCPEIVDNILNERRARRVSRSTCKSIRIINGNTITVRTEKSCA